MEITLKDIAERIAPLDYRDPAELHIQLRNPKVKALLVPSTVGAGQTAAVKYEAREAIRARLLLALLDIGLSSEELQGVNAELSALNPLKVKGFVGGVMTAPPSCAKGYGVGLANLIRGTEAGESWVLRLRYVRTVDGARRISTRIMWAEWDDREGRGTKALDLLHAETHLGTLDVPASDLIRPLVRGA
ncbi:hypothetical protein RNZ50_23940 [Paracoccaceae bacterium Fryx2]|nr:hypothetical protein [Paracoccaceae bacterium Fryx2]